jgi:4a-hydroxytetrahydrobiopterin dehydratase
MGDKDRMTGDQVTTQLTTEGLADWRPVLGKVVTRFKTGDFVTGLQLVTKVTEAAESANHHPDVDLRYPHVDITLMSHDVGGTTQRDIRLAREISQIAAGLGVEAEPGLRQFVELALDTWAEAEIKPFWAALLGAEDREYDVADPSGQIPPLWFQETDRHEVPRQRFHLDVWVPVDQAQPRIDAALAAGGTLVSDEHAPSYVVLADAHGNKACICTSASRG